MPVARGNSHPMGIPINVPVVVAPVVDPQVEPVGAVVEAEGDDEKTYCFCNSVSYGEMIACDDNTCEREWVCFVLLFIIFVDTDVAFSVPSSMYRVDCTAGWHLVL